MPTRVKQSVLCQIVNLGFRRNHWLRKVLERNEAKLFIYFPWDPLLKVWLFPLLMKRNSGYINFVNMCLSCFSNFLIDLVRCWWRFQSRVKRVFNSWVSRRWLQWCRSACYSNPNWDHYFGHQDSECSGREGTTNPWTYLCGTEEIWIPWGNCRGTCRNLVIKFLGQTVS